MLEKNMPVRFGKPLFVGAALLFLGLAAGGDAAADNSLKMTTGYDYSSGDYGQDVTTEIQYIPVTLEYMRDAWSASLTVPYIRVTGNGTVVPGTGAPAVSPNFITGIFGTNPATGGTASRTTTVTNSGLGDVIASVAYAFFPSHSLIPFIELRGKVKFGTADEDKALGSGENDYSMQLDGVLGNGSVQPFYTVGYINIGDPDNIDYNDGFFGTAGVMYKINTLNTIGLTFDYQQAAVDGVDDLEVVGAFFSSKFSPGWSAILSMSTGLTDSSLDYGGNFMLGREF